MGRRRWHPTPVLLPGRSHGRRSLVGCGPWGCEELNTTGRLHFHFSLSCIGEGNGNPLQCSCLENPKDGGMCRGIKKKSPDAITHPFKQPSERRAWRRQWQPTPVLLPGKSHGPGRLQSVGSLRVRHDWATSLSLFTFLHWRRKWQPTPVFLPGESQGWGAWWAAVYGVTQSQTRLK